MARQTIEMQSITVPKSSSTEVSAVVSHLCKHIRQAQLGVKTTGAR